MCHVAEVIILSTNDKFESAGLNTAKSFLVFEQFAKRESNQFRSTRANSLRVFNEFESL